MKPDPSRVDWGLSQGATRRSGSMRAAGSSGDFWFGFDVAHSGGWARRGCSTPWLTIQTGSDIFNTYLDINIAMMQMVLDAGYTVDEIYWPDDMGYKKTSVLLAEHVSQPNSSRCEASRGLDPRARHEGAPALLRAGGQVRARICGDRHRRAQPLGGQGRDETRWP